MIISTTCGECGHEVTQPCSKDGGISNVRWFLNLKAAIHHTPNGATKCGEGEHILTIDLSGDVDGRD